MIVAQTLPEFECQAIIWTWNWASADVSPQSRTVSSGEPIGKGPVDILCPHPVFEIPWESVLCKVMHAYSRMHNLCMLHNLYCITYTALLMLHKLCSISYVIQPLTLISPLYLRRNILGWATNIYFYRFQMFQNMFQSWNISGSISKLVVCPILANFLKPIQVSRSFLAMRRSFLAMRRSFLAIWRSFLTIIRWFFTVKGHSDWMVIFDQGSANDHHVKNGPTDWPQYFFFDLTLTIAHLTLKI